MHCITWFTVDLYTEASSSLLFHDRPQSRVMQSIDMVQAVQDLKVRVGGH